MKASLLYRIAAVLLVLFTIGHLSGFSSTQPEWHVDAALASLRGIRFDVMGFNAQLGLA